MRVHSNPNIKKEITDRSLKDLMVRGKMIVQKDNTIEIAKFCLLHVYTSNLLPVTMRAEAISNFFQGIIDYKGVCKYIEIQGYAADVVDVRGRLTIRIDHPIG